MVKVKWKKALAAAVAAAMTMMAVPSMVFADEVEAQPEEVIVYESNEEESDNETVEETDSFSDADLQDSDELFQKTDDDLKNAKILEQGKKETDDASGEQFAYYRFIPEKTGRYTINLSADENVAFRMHDNPTFYSLTGRNFFLLEDESTKNLEEPADLIKGVTYYVIIEGKGNGSRFELSIDLRYEVTQTDKSKPELLKFDTQYVGTFANGFRDNPAIYRGEDGNLSFNYHYYKFELKKPGSFILHMEDDSKKPDWNYVNYRIINDINDDDGSEDSNMCWKWHTHNEDNFNTSTNTWLNEHDCTISLLEGTYFFVTREEFGSDWDQTLTYKFKFSDFKPLEKKSADKGILFDTKYKGSNDSFDFLDTGYNGYYSPEKNGDMPSILINNFYRGILTEDSLVDFYHFELTKDSPLYLSLESDEGIGKCRIELYAKYSLYDGDEPSVYKVILEKDDWFSTNAKPIVSEPILNCDRNVNGSKDNYPHPTFKKGEYAIKIYSERTDDPAKRVFTGRSGQYRFMLSTGKVSEKPVKSLKLDKSVIALGVDGTATLKATVTPKDASDTSVNVSVEPKDIIEVIPADAINGVTDFEIKALKKGQAKITITTNGANAKKEPLTAECIVSVIDGKTCGFVAEKQKVDLKTADYFNIATISKDDKFEVTPKGVGSVSNGIFTAKKACENVTITWYRKDVKVSIPQSSVTITIEKPQYFKNDKNKDIKDISIVRKNDEVMPNQMINFEGAGILPNYYDCNAKEGFVEFDHTTGLLKVLKSGNFKVTAYYGYDLEAAKSEDKNVRKNAGKNAGKIEYTVKAKLPTVKDQKVKPNASGKDKIVTITVSNVPKDIKLTADAWKAVKVGEDGKPTSEKADFEPSPVAVKESYTKCTVAIPAATPAQTFAVVVTVDGEDYPAIVTIQ